MNSPEDNIPSNRPQSSLYQMTAERERKGMGGIIMLVLLALLLGGGAYYYFKNHQKSQVATVVPVSSPQPSVAVRVATPTPYDSVTEQKYITQADDAFMAIQQPKVRAFNESFAAFKNAGYVNPKGLTSKEAVAARRDLIAKSITANDDYLTFVTTQEATYRDALAKTPLTPADQQRTFTQYVEKAKTPDVIKLRQAETDYLKSSDDMMAALEKWYGNWSITPAGKLNFKRKENISEYNELAQKCNAKVAVVSKLQNDFNGQLSPDVTTPPSAVGDGTAVASPAASPVPATAAASPAAATP